jgi:hypothetical protein
VSTVTVAQYRVWTQDSTTPSGTVEASLELAEQMVAEYLRRDDLGSSERTERVRVHRTGLAYPRHTPITALPPDASYQLVNTVQLRGVRADDAGVVVVGDWYQRTDDYPSSLPYATVVYTGGWTTETLPVAIQRVVALAARTLAGAAQPVQPGVARAMVGDVQVDYTDTAAQADEALDMLVPLATASLRRYRWRPL